MKTKLTVRVKESVLTALKAQAEPGDLSRLVNSILEAYTTGHDTQPTAPQPHSTTSITIDPHNQPPHHAQLTKGQQIRLNKLQNLIKK